MFEKEAMKDYTDNLEGKLEVNNESRLEEQFEDTFIRGAICGYNKANEWHYVKDEKDLPTDKTEYLLLLENGIRTFGFYNGKWWESWKGDLSWQEVKAYFFVPVPELPKESE